MIKMYLDGIKSAVESGYRHTMIKALFEGGVKGIRKSSNKIYSFFLFFGLIITLFPAMLFIDLSNVFKRGLEHGHSCIHHNDDCDRLVD